ncbi:MAG: IS1634 family transposase [Actinomycetota bacterium]
MRKIKDGRPYWYVVESARVNGRPRIVRQRYLGTPEAIEAAFDAAFEPETIEEVEFGASAAMWQLAGRVGVGVAVDAAVPKRRQGLSVGAYLQAAAVNRAVAPTSKRGFCRWYEASVLSRILPAPQEAWSSQRFWDAMDRVPQAALEAIEQAMITRAVGEFGVDRDALVYDATNFHTYIATTNPRAPVAQRGHAKNGRHDLRLVGLALACSTDHQIPLASLMVPGNTADVRGFEQALPRLVRRLEAVGVEPASVTVVFDKGNNSQANFSRVAAAGIGFVGSLVPSQHAALLAVGDSEFSPVEGIEGVAAYRTTRHVFDQSRTVVVTRSDAFLAKQLVGLAQTRARVEAQLAELDRLLAGGRHRMDRAALEARVAEARSPRWMRELYPCEVSGGTRSDLALSWRFDEDAFALLRQRELGKRIVFTDRDTWTTPDIVAAYRSQWEVEAAFRQLKDPDHAAFRPIYHWTEQKIHVHGHYCVAALLILNLAWRQARHAGLELSPTEVIEALGAIREVTLLYPPAKGKGRPRVLRKLTRMDQTQRALFELFELDAFAPRVGNTGKWRGF